MKRLSQLLSPAPTARRTRLGLNRNATCEPLEGRALLSGGMGMLPGLGMGGYPGMADVGGMGISHGTIDKFARRFVDSSSIAGGGHGFMGHRPTLSAAATTAMRKLQTDLKADVPAGAKPTAASLANLKTDMTAIHQGSLSGTAAQTTIASDQAAILASMGLSSAQVAQITADQQSVQTAMGGSGGGMFGPGPGGPGLGQPPAGANWGGSAAVSAAMKTVQTDLKAAIPSGATPSSTATSTLQTDLASARAGTLTGDAAVTQIKADAAAVLESMGATATQTAQIQTDEQALQTALTTAKPAGLAANPTGPAASFGVYLMGLRGPGGMARFHP